MRARLQVSVLGTVWSLLSVLFFLKWQAPVRGWIFGSLGAAFLVSGLFIPAAAEAIHRALKAVGVGIMLVLTGILLGSAYYLLIMPLGWILRASGSLRTRKVQPGEASYWKDRPEEPLTVGRYLRPF